MSAIQSSSRFENQTPGLGKSAAETLIELGIALAGAECRAPVRGFCSHCWGPQSPHSATTQWPNVFCSEDCEQAFVRAALASLTVEDCIRMHGRLETLLTGTQESGF